jgi:integrase
MGFMELQLPCYPSATPTRFIAYGDAMPTVSLNGRTAPGLTCPEGRSEIIYWSDDLPGFGLRCRVSGARTWFVQYRTKSGQTRKHALGDPASVVYAKARAEAGRLIASAKLGGDPAGEVEAAKREAKTALAVAELADRYLDNQKPRIRPRSYIELERHLKKHAKPLHSEGAGKVTQRAIVDLLHGVAKGGVSGGPIAANRVRASLSAMFAWGMKAGVVPANPVAATFKPADEKPRERVLADRELELIWSCTNGAGDHDRIVRLLMLTGARREEIAGMRWAEIALADEGGAIWTLPSERSKNGLPHMLTLPALAVRLLPPSREECVGERRELLFGEGRGPFSGWSRCKERLDERIGKANDGRPIAPWVLHDLRRTFVTRLNDLGVEPHVIEALVNHVGGLARAGVAGVYNRSAYSMQKRAALALWCDHIAKLTGDGGDEGCVEVARLRRAS